ncbi:MAG: NAD(P)/FAD-dependent oxidoreductase [Clostridiales bacterium]|nr:NAD(P)/FAD-dependent oxidoreductase [Clostridiales bacterium]
MTDVIIIGAGVVGCAVARELSKYNAKVVVIERRNDVACGASKANSGIVHAGFDAIPGTKKAYYNVLGAKMYAELYEELDIPYRKNGAFVLNFSEEGNAKLEELYAQGVANGVEGNKIISGDEVRAMEPAVSKDVVSALYVPSSAIVGPYEATLAFAENANVNGVEFVFDTKVLSVEKQEHFTVKTDKGDFESQVVINCAGVYSDEVNNTASIVKEQIVARKGEYCLLDKSYGDITDKTLFQLPTKMGKGVLVSPTVHGNIIVGPTAEDVDDKDYVDTTYKGLNTALALAMQSLPTLPRRGIITQFSGLRSHNVTGDFVIGEREDVKGFYNALGVESPGLTSAPAIALDLATQIAQKYGYEKKENFISKREGIKHFATMTDEERAEAIKNNPLYGKVVCRCEVVTEAEIVDSITRPLGARDLDGVKRRTRAGMGRCQSGFCSPKIMEVIAKNLGIDILQVSKHGAGSEILVGKIKE